MPRIRRGAFGFRSHMSMWDGPPSIKNKIQDFAFAGRSCVGTESSPSGRFLPPTFGFGTHQLRQCQSQCAKRAQIQQAAATQRIRAKLACPAGLRHDRDTFSGRRSRIKKTQGSRQKDQRDFSRNQRRLRSSSCCHQLAVFCLYECCHRVALIIILCGRARWRVHSWYVAELWTTIGACQFR